MKRFLLTLALALLPAMATHASPPPTAPGKYKNWDGGTLDDLEIVQPFHLRDYQKIIVLPIDASALTLPTDNTLKPVQKTLRESTSSVADQIDGDLPNRMKVKAQAGEANAPAAPGVMFLRARFVEMDAGSRTARFFSKGFAGASHVTMSGEFVDSVTGKVLLRFTHHNYHGGGLRYTAILEENEQQIADALAKLLKAFYP